nr:putative phage tail protein [Marispirochaeta aestuarii]
MRSTLRSLFPPGHPWQLFGNIGQLVDALALSLERLREFLMDVITESNPGTATDTLQQWYAQLGITYDPTQSTATLRKRAKQAFTAIGGQSKEYIEAVLQVAYPNVTIEEVEIEPINQVGIGMIGKMVTTDYQSWVPAGAMDGTYPVYYYRVTGEISTPYDLNGIQNILDRIAPLTHTAVYDVTVLGITDTAMVGLGVTGLAEVGKE